MKEPHKAEMHKALKECYDELNPVPTDITAGINCKFLFCIVVCNSVEQNLNTFIDLK